MKKLHPKGHTLHHGTRLVFLKDSCTDLSEIPIYVGVIGQNMFPTRNQSIDDTHLFMYTRTYF
jgi:hypothetical protein